MTDDAAVRAVLAAAVPAHVQMVCGVLARAGHQAVTVGGAVRDALLGRAPGDWDVATSARPEAVVALFKRTIPTGLQHGTVTVITGRPSDVDTHVEVTTFRGEGAYTDARRPDHVVFGVPLVEDLARRDLVVNAIAFEPATGELHDPFGGRADLAARRLRAVGDAVARFTEDGLRVMRVVRFAAVLEFALDPATEAGIAPALPSLAKVSRERVSDELRKLLAAPRPSLGLAIAVRTGIVETIAPDIAAKLGDAASVADWLARIDRVPVSAPSVRLAAFAAPLAPDAKRAEAILRALKFSNAEAGLAAQLVGVARAVAEPTDVTDASWSADAARRLCARLGRDRVAPAIELWRATAPSSPLIALAEQALADHVPLAVADLAITGTDLIATLGLRPGPQVGRTLAALLDRVLADPTANTRDALFAAARELLIELPA